MFENNNLKFFFFRLEFRDFLYLFIVLALLDTGC